MPKKKTKKSVARKPADKNKKTKQTASRRVTKNPRQRKQSVSRTRRKTSSKSLKLKDIPKNKKDEAILKLIKLYAFVLPKDYNKKTKKGGRPSVMTANVLRKLEYAFAYDCTNEEACILAGIFPSTFYDFIKAQPKFSDTITLLRHIPVLLARQTIVHAVIDDPEKALKYLERKKKIEFSPKIELSHEGDIKNTQDISPEAKEAVDNLFTIFEKKALAVAEDLILDDDDKGDNKKD